MKTGHPFARIQRLMGKRMATPKAKLEAFLVAALLLLQPLAALSACLPAEAAASDCCPMPHPSAPADPVTAVPGAPDCCAISSSEPAPSPAVAKGAEASRVPVLAAAAGVEPRVEAEAPALLASVAPPRTGSSLQTLYCVFLV